MVDLKKRKDTLDKLKIQQLKDLLKLHNSIHNCRPRDKNYQPLSGCKSDLTERVLAVLYHSLEVSQAAVASGGREILPFPDRQPTPSKIAR